MVSVLEQFDENKILKTTVLFNLNDSSTYNSVKLLPNSKLYFADINERSFDVNEMTSNLISDYELILNHKQGTLDCQCMENFQFVIYRFIRLRYE